MRKVAAFIVLALFLGGAGGYLSTLPTHANRLQAPTSSGTPAFGWNISHYNSACSTLSGTNNVIATGTGGGTDCIVYAVNGQSTGKYYGEIDVSGTVTAETALGLGNSASLTSISYLGFDASTLGMFDGGSVFNQNAAVPVGTGVPYATAQNVCIAVDLTSVTPRVWFANMTVGAGWEGGGTDSPATGTGGTALNQTGMTITSNPVVLGIDVPPAGVLTIVPNLACSGDTVHGYGSAYLAGFSPWPGSTSTLANETWNPNRVSGTFPNTFSGGNLTVTAGAGANGERNTYGTPLFLIGRYYWQVTVTFTGIAANTSVGIGNGASTSGLSFFLGEDNNSIGYYADGNVFLNNVNPSGSPIATYASGAAICVAVDYTNAKIWFQPIGSGQWNNAAIGSQSPSGNVGGFSISAVTASGTVAISPAATLYTAGDTSVANFSSTPCSGVTGLSGFSTIP